MAELPENLQIIKAEVSQYPETEAQPRRLIKERLNLHVKRRLHHHQHQTQNQELQEYELQQAHQQHQQIQTITHPSGEFSVRDPMEVAAHHKSPQSANMNVNSIASDVIAPQSTLKRKEKQQKESAKTRKPYQKRTDKNTTTTTKTQAQMQITAEDGGKAPRKNKRLKHPVVGTAVPTSAGNAGHISGVGGEGASSLCLSPVIEEGDNETDGRDMYPRDKEKCPDILGMVLCAKKRALMQNVEVQEFLGKLMAVFKN